MARRPARVGLTGGIASGKSTVAARLRQHGVPVFDADAAVHALYDPDGPAVAPVMARFGNVGDARGGIDRARLAEVLGADSRGLVDLEAIVHPLVRQAEERFIREAEAEGAPFVVLDIPLLFETGRAQDMDALVVVACAPETQRTRALARPGMTPEKLDLVLARQWPLAGKAARADHVINADQPLDRMLQQVDDLAEELARRFAAEGRS